MATDVPHGISNNPVNGSPTTSTARLFTSGSGDSDDDKSGDVDSTAVIIGAVVAAIILILCVVLVLALLYRKRVKDQQINAVIASHTATSPHFETFSQHSIGHSAGPHVNNSMYQPNPFSTQAFDSAAAIAGAFQCPLCSNCYPSEQDVLIHVQKRHQESPSSGYTTAQWGTGEVSSTALRPMVTYDSELPADTPNYRAYDIPSQPSHLYVVAPPTESQRQSGGNNTHEPANYRGLQPYSTMGEERFAKFQS